MKIILIISTFVLVSCAQIEKKPQVVAKNSVSTYMAPNKLAFAHHQIENSCEHYMGSLVIMNEMKVPEHTHPKSDEYLYVIKGGGSLVMDGKEYKVKRGDAIFIPKGVKHSYKNGGKFTEFVQVYTPKGPEQRFKKWIKKETVKNRL